MIDAVHNPPSVALLFEKFGDYHIARFKAARDLLAVTGIELSPQSRDYPWFHSDESPHLVRCFPPGHGTEISLKERCAALNRCLDKLKPDIVAIPGWSHPGALLALQWCGKRQRPAIMMCDSTYHDAPRHWLSERIKASLLRGVSAGLVSGTKSRKYLEKLGLASDRIVTGYDVIDNQHFRSGAEAARSDSDSERARLGLPGEYLLFVGRLVPKKNVNGLLNAYAIYRRDVGSLTSLPLVIVGDGVLYSALRDEAGRLGLNDCVCFYGHASYKDMPALYGLARVFILPSIVEQWGLVVNEAIACALPVIVSYRSGASADLVVEGKNGCVCDPADVEDMARKIKHLAHADNIQALGQFSESISKQWSLRRFARALEQTVLIALEDGSPPGLLARLIAGASLLKARADQYSPPETFT